jgi:hypothetical protein
MLIDPVQVGVRLPAGVMIDINEISVFQTLKAGSLDGIALEDDHRSVVLIHAIIHVDLINPGKAAIDVGSGVREDHRGLATHLLQYFGER